MCWAWGVREWIQDGAGKCGINAHCASIIHVCILLLHWFRFHGVMKYGKEVKFHQNVYYASVRYNYTNYVINNQSKWTYLACLACGINGFIRQVISYQSLTQRTYISYLAEVVYRALSHRISSQRWTICHAHTAKYPRAAAYVWFGDSTTTHSEVISNHLIWSGRCVGADGCANLLAMCGRDLPPLGVIDRFWMQSLLTLCEMNWIAASDRRRIIFQIHRLWIWDSKNVNKKDYIF